MTNRVSLRARMFVRAGLLLGSALVTQPLLAQGAAPAEGGNSGGGIEEIIVTAQKREQNLQNVPISITALTQDSIKANRIQDIRDLNAIAPNLTVRF